MFLPRCKLAAAVATSTAHCIHCCYAFIIVAVICDAVFDNAVVLVDVVVVVAAAVAVTVVATKRRRKT